MIFMFFDVFSLPNSLEGHCHEIFVTREKPKAGYVLISDNLQTMIPFRIKVVYK